MNAIITDIQRFCMHDGPGIRTTVFFKGCPLHCKWCHNPETQSFKRELLFTEKLCVGCGACEAVCPQKAHNITASEHLIDREKCVLCGACVKACAYNALEISGREISPDGIVAEALKDVAFYGTKGGITLSGGEPTAQPEALIEILEKSKENGLSTVLETCGFFPATLVPKLAPLVDVFYWDIKDTDTVRHKDNTGAPLSVIEARLREVDKMLRDGQKIRLRCIMIAGINMNVAHYEALAELQESLLHCEGIELLPYHAMYGAKEKRLGQEDTGCKAWIPSEEMLREAEEAIVRAGGKLSFGRRSPRENV